MGIDVTVVPQKVICLACNLQYALQFTIIIIRMHQISRKSANELSLWQQEVGIQCRHRVDAKADLYSGGSCLACLSGLANGTCIE